MKNFTRLAFIVLSVFTLTGCGLWDSFFPPATPPPAPTASPFTYTPPVPPQDLAAPVPAQLIVPPTTTPTVPPTSPPIVSSSSNCLVGTWLADHTSLTNYMAGALTGMTISIPSGNLTMSFAADGTFQQQTDRMVMTAALGGSAGNLSMEVNGTITGNYTDNTGTATFHGIGESKNEVTNVTVNGVAFAQAPINFDTQFVSNDSSLNYDCSSNALTISWVLEGRTLTLILTRIS